MNSEKRCVQGKKNSGEGLLPILQSLINSRKAFVSSGPSNCSRLQDAVTFRCMCTVYNEQLKVISIAIASIIYHIRCHYH